MKKSFQPECLDVAAFAAMAGQLSGRTDVSALSRLSDECESETPAPVFWEARGELRGAAPANPQTWVHLMARTEILRACQRCLRPVSVELTVDRWFRFVADEHIASQLDEESEDDVLVSSRSFDLIALLEDELLLAMPLVPRHRVCPDLPAAMAGDPPGTDAQERLHPFAGLANIRLNR